MGGGPLARRRAGRILIALEVCVSQSEVLVVGAGPVGLTAAADLARRGIRSRVIDQAVGPSTTSKAIAIQPRTLEVFHRMGIVDEILARGFVVGAGNFYWHGRSLARIDFKQLDSRYGFIVDLPQNETEEVLLEHLVRNGITVERETRLVRLEQDEAGVDVEVVRPGGAEKIRCSYVVGCDGAYSTVRHALDLKFAVSPNPESLVLGDAEVDWLYPSELHIFIDPDGFLACFPLPGSRFRLIADVTVQEPVSGPAAGRPPKATPERFREIIRKRADADANVREVTWLAGFRIQRQVVEQYGKGRVFVAGDAAHVPSPAGGQGMNTGIQDACNLAWKIQIALRGDASAGLLESYSAERGPVGRSVVALSDRLSNATVADLPTLVHQISEIGINYRESPIVAEDWNGGAGPEPGDRAPLIEGLDGTSHHMLLFTSDDPDLRALAEVQRLATHGFICPRLITPRPVSWNEPQIPDESGALHAKFGARSPCVYLVRPDGYIGYRGSPPDAKRVASYLETIFR